MASAGSFIPQGLYYKHSGSFSVPGALIALVLGLLVGLPAAWLYAYLIRWNPIVYISFLATLGFGALMGYATESFLEKQRCRSVPVTVAVALLVTVISYYVSWAVWLHAILIENVSVFVFLLNPVAMWELIQRINAEGAWSIKKDVVKGVALWVVWGAEAAVIFGTAGYTAAKAMLEACYCEGCDSWTVEKNGVCAISAGAAPSPSDKDAMKTYLKGFKERGKELKERMEAKDFQYLENQGVADPKAAFAWYRLDLHSCPKCGMTNTLRITRFQHKLEGKTVKAELLQNQILRQLNLNSSEAELVRRLQEKLAPTPAAPAPAS